MQRRTKVEKIETKAETVGGLTEQSRTVRGALDRLNGLELKIGDLIIRGSRERVTLLGDSSDVKELDPLEELHKRGYLSAEEVRALRNDREDRILIVAFV